MKKVLLAGLMCLFALAVQAKYKTPEGIRTQNDKNADYMFSYMDKDGDGKLTLDEYKSKVVTRDVERQIRKDKKEGTYKTPAEEFAIMDTDKDGYITPADLSGYLRSNSDW